MCDYCETIHNEIMEHGKGEEDIFYNVKEEEYYFVVEQARYERTRVKINNCPYCGRKLKGNSSLYNGVELHIGDNIRITYKNGECYIGEILKINIGEFKSFTMQKENMAFICHFKNIDNIEKIKEIK